MNINSKYFVGISICFYILSLFLLTAILAKVNETNKEIAKQLISDSSRRERAAASAIKYLKSKTDNADDKMDNSVIRACNQASNDCSNLKNTFNNCYNLCNDVRSMKHSVSGIRDYLNFGVRPIP